MTLLQDKRQRTLILTTIFLLSFLLVGMFALNLLQEQRIQHLALTRTNAMVSALLEDGVPADVCARAVTGNRISSEGAALLRKLGFSANNSFSVHETQNTFLTATLLFISFTGCLQLLVLFLFVRKQESLYREAAETVTRYTGGDFSCLLPPWDNGGLSHLFNKINTMATALQAGQETEKQAKIFLKNTVSDISHQLKTPLAALSMYNEIIRDETNHPMTVQTFSEKSAASINRMEHLIKTLLKLTRLDAGGIEFHKESCPAGILVRTSIEELTTRAGREQKILSLHGEEQAPIFCDKDWTMEALENIVKNALDHTDNGGHIRISWESSPDMTRLSVTDDGSGIPEEDIHHIFKRFYRSKNARDAQGVGLGLPLAKSIMEGQGGFLTVESFPGAGTTFLLSFPGSKVSQLTKL